MSEYDVANTERGEVGHETDEKNIVVLSHFARKKITYPKIVTGRLMK